MSCNSVRLTLSPEELQQQPPQPKILPNKGHSTTLVANTSHTKLLVFGGMPAFAITTIFLICSKVLVKQEI